MIDSLTKVIQERAKHIQEEQEKQYNSYIKNYYLEHFYFKGTKVTITGANINYKHEYKEDKVSIETYSYWELELSISLINKIKLPMEDVLNIIYASRHDYVGYDIPNHIFDMLDEATSLEKMLGEGR